MPVITRTTTTSGTRTTTTSTIPIWLIKLLTVILCFVVLTMMYLVDNGVRTYYPTTFIVLGVTVGALLGWSIGSVLQQLLSFRNVEILINAALTVLAILSAILVFMYLINTGDSSSTNRFKLMLVAGVALIIQSIVCVMMLSWAYSGNIIIVRNI